ncbi:hypothetical protein [Crenobacter caeni]|uniref:Uncharacterized protein n=1 Tax=Crenobacter caeni TaxID=2705474 RepID=A0A6B2KRS8_9NEIS|nr:hypothetical protein [Crenobacter caeni]NDV12659.1 hypothetical protein [Crenobacter caeni]
MHDIKTFINTPLNELKKMRVGEKVELLTYKKDRKIVITKQDQGTFHVVEDGFEHKEFRNVEAAKLEHLLKQLKSVEFPKNRKYYMVKHRL